MLPFTEEKKKVLLSFLQQNLKDTIFLYTPSNTLKEKRGYIRYYCDYHKCILLISKNRIIMINGGRFNWLYSNESNETYKINNGDDFIATLKMMFNRFRFFSEHHPEPGKKYSIYNLNS
jgi:hypothetical protein